MRTNGSNKNYVTPCRYGYLYVNGEVPAGYHKDGADKKG